MKARSALEQAYIFADLAFLHGSVGKKHLLKMFIFYRIKASVEVTYVGYKSLCPVGCSVHILSEKNAEIVQITLLIKLLSDICLI